MPPLINVDIGYCAVQIGQWSQKVSELASELAVEQSQMLEINPQDPRPEQRRSLGQKQARITRINAFIKIAEQFVTEWKNILDTFMRMAKVVSSILQGN